MSNRKTIQINPDLFSISPKKRGKQSTPTVKPPKKQPAIRPNSLKKKLIQRVKEHKLKESKEYETAKKAAQDIMTIENNNKYVEEFNDSINYLNQLSNQNKNLLKQKRKTFTLKNPNPLPLQPPQVILDTSDDLHVVPPIPNIPENEPAFKLNYNQNNQQSSIPYGCLKGGTKPTYKSWIKTQKYNTQDVSQPKLDLPIETTNQFNKTNEREKKLNDLKNKIKQKHEQELSEQKYFFDNNVITSNDTEPTYSEESTSSSLPLPIPTSLPISDIPKKIKKTTKKTYKLGKSDKNKSIGVLIKDRKTRKKVIDAQKELKRKNITDVKQHLRDHGLIKAGSKAPNDIMRKMYECSMLSGDITNQDSDVLMHNFLNENE